MITAFISHSTKDRVFVEQEMIPFLESLGITSWYSQDDIKVTATWERSIREALIRSDWVVVILSPNAVQSDWVRSEVHWALENRIGRVIPVRLRPCDPSDLHLKLAGIQYADYDSDPAAARLRLSALFGCASFSIAENGVQNTVQAEWSPQKASLPGGLDAELAVLATTGKYEVIRLIARTGSGVTLLARQTALNHDVIVKSYSLSSASPEQARRIVGEIQQRSRLRHPVLVAPIEIIAAENTLFVVTQYLTGVVSIRELLRGEVRGGAPVLPETVCQLLSQVALGLSHAHAMGVSHQSLDPWDILVNSDNMVWVAGFERSVVYDYYKTCGLLNSFGTLVPISPEFARGEPLDSATDVYHIGLILFELLTGAAPFNFMRITQSMFDVEPLQVRLNRVADLKLSTLCLRCLKPRKEDRFADAAELFEAFLSAKGKERWWHFWK